MNNQNEQNKSLLNYQNVRAILSLAYIDSKIPKSTLMKIEIKQVLETVNNEIELLVFRNGGYFLCAISRILQKKCALLMQELRDFYDNFKNKGLVQPKRGVNQTTSRKNRTLLRTTILDGDSSIFNASTASIEELSNQSIQNPRNIASKDKITMPSIITPFRAQPPELVGSSNLLTNDKFSEELTLSSGVADLLGAKSSLIKSLDHDIRKSPMFNHMTEDIIQEEPLPIINVMDVDQSEQESNVSVGSNLSIINDNRFGEITGAVRNEGALSFKDRIERSKNQSQKKQRHKNFFDEEIELKDSVVALNLNQDFESIEIDAEQEETKDSVNIDKEEKVMNPNKMPDNLMKKNLLDRISKNLAKVSLDDLEEQDKPKFVQSEKKNMPFKFSLHEDLPFHEMEEAKAPLENEDNNDNNEQILQEQENRNDFLENDYLEQKEEKIYERLGSISHRKNINEQEDAINQNLLKLIREMSEERKINDFEHLNHLTKDTYSKAQLFIELLQLVRQESIIMNQSAPFGKITFGLL